MSGVKLHADDTPIPVLEPGNGKTRTGRLWTYVRDDRPAGDETPPAVWFAYSEDRRGEHPRQHLKSFRGALQADAYAGFHHLYGSDTTRQSPHAIPHQSLNYAQRESGRTPGSRPFSRRPYQNCA